MARIVKRMRNGPYSVLIDGTNTSFCGRGKTEEPGTLYWYDAARRRHLAAERFPGLATEQQMKITSGSG